MKVIKRDGRAVEYNREKIEIAIEKANKEVQEKGKINKYMYERLIIDGNSVYEVDEECLKRRNVPTECRVKEAVERQIQKEKATKEG